MENKDSFFNRLTGRVTPKELLKVKTAYMLAKYAHRAQLRIERVRYFEHVKR